MSMDAKNEANAAKPITEESNNNNNNNNNKHLDMLDDLTNQLVTALDTNDVVGWKPSEESPFGKWKIFYEIFCIYQLVYRFLDIGKF